MIEYRTREIRRSERGAFRNFRPRRPTRDRDRAARENFIVGVERAIEEIEQFGSRKLERARSAHTYRRSIPTRRLDYYWHNQYGLIYLE